MTCDHARYEVVGPGPIGEPTRQRRRCKLCRHTWTTVDADLDTGVIQALAYADREHFIAGGPR